MTTTDFIQIIGTAAFAVSGYLVGYSKRLDVLGVIITALLNCRGRRHDARCAGGACAAGVPAY